ncbi:MAG: RHS repeat-associated core domain-containing protein [Verrucomicrobiae bacterium]|nr:RHS repeat-associated core domain-containing protein [Verrucomicrobiae bacterium]
MTAIRVKRHDTRWKRLEFANDLMSPPVANVVRRKDGSRIANPMDNRHLCDCLNLRLVAGAQYRLLQLSQWGMGLSAQERPPPHSVRGAGGLLAVYDASTLNHQPSTHFVADDGHGNVTLLVNGGTGAESTRYEYGPFGEPLRATGPLAKENPFRFSTKRTDHTTDLVLYEYRPYSPSLGRWLSRDPIGELGFTPLSGGTQTTTGMEFDDESNGAPISERGDENLYVFVGNDPISFLDILGLVDFRFEPVVGELSGMIVGAGQWGQPFNYADGSASSDSKSARTFIKVWSGPTSAGSCNTVKFKGKYGDNAGAITVYAQDKCPGKYKIYFDLTYEIKTTGLRGNALLRVDKITESVVGRTATIKKKKMIAVVVNLPANQVVTVLRYDPIIAFPPEPKKRNSTGSIDFNVEVVRVKKLD